MFQPAEAPEENKTKGANHGQELCSTTVVTLLKQAEIMCMSKPATFIKLIYKDANSSQHIYKCIYQIL